MNACAVVRPASVWVCSMVSSWADVDTPAACPSTSRCDVTGRQVPDAKAWSPAARRWTLHPVGGRNPNRTLRRRTAGRETAMSEHSTCVVVGGGPAGMVAGLLLTRAGVEVTVLEKHADFLRDFRGDTVHPSTLILLDELGLGDKFDALPHSELTAAGFPTEDGGMLKLADMTRLKVPHPYIAMVPQWDFLNLLADSAAAEKTFTLRMNTEM